MQCICMQYYVVASISLSVFCCCFLLLFFFFGSCFNISVFALGRNFQNSKLKYIFQGVANSQHIVYLIGGGQYKIYLMSCYILYLSLLIRPLYFYLVMFTLASYP